MKTAVLSDIHGNLLALQAVVQDMQRRGVGQVINLGDHASGPLWPQETLAFLMQTTWLQIAGNQDHQLVGLSPAVMGPSDRYAYEHTTPEAREWLGRLPSEIRLEISGQSLLVCHGAPGDEYQYLLETVEAGQVRRARPDEIALRLQGEQANLILCGHTHLQQLVWVAGSLIANPGSVGLPAYADDSPAHVVESGTPHARYTVIEYTPDGWKVALLAVPYDHQAAAEQARQNGRPDWEIALRTGYMNER